jgi:hypothetical protein
LCHIHLANLAVISLLYYVIPIKVYPTSTYIYFLKHFLSGYFSFSWNIVRVLVLEISDYKVVGRRCSFKPSFILLFTLIIRNVGFHYFRFFVLQNQILHNVLFNWRQVLLWVICSTTANCCLSFYPLFIIRQIVQIVAAVLLWLSSTFSNNCSHNLFSFLIKPYSNISLLRLD